jgi:16S rRNA U516 pseudouridylate synthase RsuA-like enzyme
MKFDSIGLTKQDVDELIQHSHIEVNSELAELISKIIEKNNQKIASDYNRMSEQASRDLERAIRMNG